MDGPIRAERPGRGIGFARAREEAPGRARPPAPRRGGGPPLAIGLAMTLLAGAWLGGPSSLLLGADRGAVLAPDAPYASIPPDRDGWTNVTAVTREPSPALESYSMAVVDGTSETAMVFGGVGAHGNVTSTTWIYDDGNWEDITPVINGSSPPPLYDVNLAFDASTGYLLLFGGRTGIGFAVQRYVGVVVRGLPLDGAPPPDLTPRRERRGDGV